MLEPTIKTLIIEKEEIEKGMAKGDKDKACLKKSVCERTKRKPSKNKIYFCRV